jgi:hypothetical protein
MRFGFLLPAWVGVFSLVLALLLLAPPASAVPINYGDFSGQTVDYLQVTEDSVTDATPLFGAPTVSGNTLDFNPVGFGAFSQNGGSDTTEGNLSFTIVSMRPGNPQGNFIEEVVFSESGTAALVDALGAGTNTTRAKITAPLVIDVTEVDGIGITPVSFNTALVYSYTPAITDPNQQEVRLGDDGEFDGLWSGSLLFNVKQALIDAGEPFNIGATEGKVNVDNRLLAVSENGTSALIDKKDFKGFSVTVVPEPSSAALLLLGVAGLTALARRRS